MLCMKCVICEKELGLQIRKVSITMLGCTTDCMVCPVCYDVVDKLRQPNLNMFSEGPDIYLSERSVKSLDVKFD